MCKDPLDNYLTERGLNDSMTKTHDNLEKQVDANNLEIGEHMKVIDDYKGRIRKNKIEC